MLLWTPCAVQTLIQVARTFICAKNEANLIFQSVFLLFYQKVTVGQASESLNEWADEDAGIEAVQKILDTLDDIAALQDTEIDPDVLISMLRDNKLHAMLQVN